MVSGEFLGQLEPLTPAEGRAEPQGRGWSDESQPHENVHGPVDGDDMGPMPAEARVDLWHRQRHAAVREDIENGTPRAGQPQPSMREEVRAWNRSHKREDRIDYKDLLASERSRKRRREERRKAMEEE